MGSPLKRSLAGLFALALVAAACGSDDTPADDTAAEPEATEAAPADTADESATTDAADESATTDAADDESATTDAADDESATTDAADDESAGTIDRTGETIKIGYVNNEGGALSLPEFRIGGEVAIDAINEAGGINGAQIEVVTCLSDATPEGAINCANELIEADVALAYMGIEVASEAAIQLWIDAGIPYLSSNSWGNTEKNSPGAYLLHSAAGAFAAAPAKAFTELGVTNIAVIGEDSPAYADFIESAIGPVMDANGIEFTEIVVDPAAPDWTAAVATAQAAGVDGIWGQLTEPGCIGLVGATAAIGYDKPVFAGSCSVFIPVLGEAAVGVLSSGDVYLPETREFAPPEIQERLDEYVEQMTAAGSEDLVNGFAVAPYSSWFEIRTILETIEGEITGESILDAFANAGVTEGWLGGDLQCGLAPWPLETSHCGAEMIVWQVVANDDGTVSRVPFMDQGFFEAFAASGL
jgi:branched-chain amino acid transport system substrate-binding protein